MSGNSTLQSLCVYCGSSTGNDPAFLEEAVTAGTLIARQGLTLVYGGGKVGLMGAVADAALAAGGRVVGVMPADLVAQEIGHKGLTELKIVNSMHERKWAMAELADGFLAQQYVDMLVYADTTAQVIEAFRAYVPPPPKWGVAAVEQRY